MSYTKGFDALRNEIFPPSKSYCLDHKSACAFPTIFNNGRRISLIFRPFVKDNSHNIKEIVIAEWSY